MMSLDISEQFCLRWNESGANFVHAFCDLRSQGHLFDVSLATDQGHVAAHKVVLSACSPVLRRLFLLHHGAGSGSQLLIYLRGVRLVHLQAVVEFIYNGKVNVNQDHLNDFLLLATDLQVKGLVDLQLPPSSHDAPGTSIQKNQPQSQTSWSTRSCCQSAGQAGCCCTSSSVRSGKRSCEGASPGKCKVRLTEKTELMAGSEKVDDMQTSVRTADDSLPIMLDRVKVEREVSECPDDDYYEDISDCSFSEIDERNRSNDITDDQDLGVANSRQNNFFTDLVCRACGEHFRQQSHFRRHFEAAHLDVALWCPDAHCDHVSPTRHSLLEHLREKHQ